MPASPLRRPCLTAPLSPRRSAATQRKNLISVHPREKRHRRTLVTGPVIRWAMGGWCRFCLRADCDDDAVAFNALLTLGCAKSGHRTKNLVPGAGSGGGLYAAHAKRQPARHGGPFKASNHLDTPSDCEARSCRESRGVDCYCGRDPSARLAELVGLAHAIHHPAAVPNLDTKVA
jgi:hypothetical protein